jgi:hypothetical protein
LEERIPAIIMVKLLETWQVLAGFLTGPLFNPEHGDMGHDSMVILLLKLQCSELSV